MNSHRLYVALSRHPWLYFAGERGNQRDGRYQPELEMQTVKPSEGAFDLVVDA